MIKNFLKRFRRKPEPQPPRVIEAAERRSRGYYTSPPVSHTFVRPVKPTPPDAPQTRSDDSFVPVFFPIEYFSSPDPAPSSDDSFSGGGGDFGGGGSDSDY